MNAKLTETGAEGSGAALGQRLARGDLSAAPVVMNLLESRADTDQLEARALMRFVSPAALKAEAKGHIVGITGPPGAGKSSLVSVLVRRLRQHEDQSVAVLAVDPSSRISGGSLLGDRIRIGLDPTDTRLFIRSTAAGERLGGLAWSTRAAAQALAVAFDFVVIETVGAGQGETEVAQVADTVLLVVQPGSGDVLQFLKAGMMEIPDVLIVSKADLGEIAARTREDLSAALRSLAASGSRASPEVIGLSSLPPTSGFDALEQAIAAHRMSIDLRARRQRLRREGAITDFAIEHGERALRALRGRRGAAQVLAGADGCLSEPELEAILVEALQARRQMCCEGQPS